jgi:hypothetical protein
MSSVENQNNQNDSPEALANTSVSNASDAYDNASNDKQSLIVAESNIDSFDSALPEASSASPRRKRRTKAEMNASKADDEISLTAEISPEQKIHIKKIAAAPVIVACVDIVRRIIGEEDLKEKTAKEKNDYKKAVEAYLETLEGEVPPWLGLAIATVGYVSDSLVTPKGQTKMQKVFSMMKQKVVGFFVK